MRLTFSARWQVAKHPRSIERLSSVNHDDAGVGEGWCRQVCAGEAALPDVRYWMNSGRHILNSSSSVFDPKETSGLVSF
jgi:hypothetical protein